jgi:hypothetical protein
MPPADHWFAETPSGAPAWPWSPDVAPLAPADAIAPKPRFAARMASKLRALARPSRVPSPIRTPAGWRNV